MDFTPESDFQTWYMLLTITIDEGGEIQCLQDDFIRILKYYIDNKTLPPEISDFNKQFIENMVPEIISHITVHSYAELNDDYSTYFNILLSIAKLLVEGLSKDIFEVTMALSYLFNFDDNFFLSIQNYSPQSPTYSQQYKKFCLEFLLNGSLETLLSRLHNPNPKIQHFFHFFRLVSLTRISSTYEEIQSYIVTLKDNLIFFIDSIDINSSRNMDSNELLFICSFSISISSDIPEFDDISISCAKFALKCITCEFLDKQICGAKLLNKIVEKTINDNRDLLIKIIKDLDIYNIIVSKNYHESILPHLCTAFDLMTQVEINPETFNDILTKIWNKIQHSHFTTKDQWLDMLLDGVNNSYVDLKIANSFLIDFLLKIEQNETTVEAIEKFIIHLPIEFLSISTKLLEFLLSILNVDSSNQNKNEKLSEIVLTAIKRIAISVNISSLRNLILNYCRKELLTAVSTNVIEILQFLIEGSSISSPGVGVSQIVNDSLIDTLICALNSNKSDKEPIFDLLASCYSKVSSTPIKMNSKQLSQILENHDENCWRFFNILFDQRNIEFLETESIRFMHSYLSEKVDYSKSDQYFVMFLYNFIMAVGIAQNKVVRKIQGKNQIRYTINDTKLEGIEFLTRILFESKDEQALNQLIDVFLYLVSVCRNLDNRGKMIENLLSFILNTKKEDNDYDNKLFNSPAFSLFVKIINKFEEGVGIEEFGIERHSPFDTSSNINITINNNLLKLNVNPYILAYSLCQKVAFHLKSTENSVFLYYDNIKLFSSYQLITLDIKDGSNLRLDKILLEPCKYSIENVPTFIFYKNQINNLCLSLLRKNCDSNDQETRAKKKQIWKLLKLLPSLKFENNDELILKIKEAVDEYELLYLLQIALKEKIECSEIILDLLKEQNENEKSKIHSIIRGKPISPAFTILSLSSIKVADYSSILLDIISNNIEKSKAIDSSIFLLTKICTESNAIVSKFLLELDYTLLSSDVLLRLIQIFKIIEDKSSLFTYISKYIADIQNSRFCMAFFTLLAVLVGEETSENKEEICNKYDDTLNLCFKLLEEHKNESLILYGACIFIAVLFEKVPSLIPKYSNLTAEILVPYLLTVTDEKTQKKISSILIKVLNQQVTRKLIASLMKSHFQDIPDRWNYDPSKNEKLISQLTGLKNLGATCFMNSILQQLYSNSEFRSEFSKYKFDTSDPKQPNNNYLVELQKLFIRMQMTSLPFSDTKDFCKLFIFQDKRPINVREQQDAIEFFQFIVDKFPESLHKMYEGQIVNTIKGIDVEFESNNYESFYNICLTVKGFDNFEDSFESFLKEEIFSGDNQYYADEIDAKIDARKYSRINKLPTHLVIQLKRFEYNLDTFMKYKVNDRFTFPFEFNAAKYTTNQDDEQMYKLTGIVIHDGVAEAGHYYSIVLINEEWYCFDDNDVYRYHPHFFNLYAYGQNNSNTPSAYLLFYTKKDSITKYFIENVINEKTELTEMKQVKSIKNSEDDEEDEYEDEYNNEKTIAYKDVKLDLFCPSSLKEEIDKENHLYNQMQSNFTFTIMQFMSLIDDPEVVILYVLNVFLHSQYSSLTRNSPSFSIYKSEKFYDSNQIISIIASNSQSLFDVLLHCPVYEQVNLFMKFLKYHICNYDYSKISNGDNNCLANLATDALNMLESSIFVYRSIPFISSIIFSFLEKQEGKEFGLSNNFAQKILDFLSKVVESNRANVFWSNLDLHYLFDSLSILKDGFELKSIVSLMNNCNNFLLSKSHSKSFIKLFMNCYEYDLFISHIFRLFTAQTIGKVIIETFCCCDNEASVKKMMALFLNQSEIYMSDISYNIYFAIEEKSILSSTSSSASLISKGSNGSLYNNSGCESDLENDDIIIMIMKYKELFLFDFLICDEEISRSYTEEIIYSLFPLFSQPKTSSNPLYDFLITTSSELLMRLKEMDIDPIKAPITNDSEEKFYEFVESFVNYINQKINSEDNLLFIKNRLTSASRVIRWMISNIVNNCFEESVDKKNLLKKLYDLNTLLLNKVVDIKTAYDGNVYELLLTSLMILTPDFAGQFEEINIDIRKIILNLFPTNSFNRYTLYISDLFLVTFIIIMLNIVNLTKDDQEQNENKEQNELLQFFDNEVFKASFIEFIRKSPPDVMDLFCRFLIEQCNVGKNRSVLVVYSQISHSILSIIEPSLHQMMIDNVFSIVKVVFSLNIQLPSDLFEDLFSFLIVCVEMNIEKKTNESLKDVIFLIEACLPHLKNQKQLNNGLIDKYIPMFLDLYSSPQLGSPHLRFILREFFGLLCQKDESLKNELISLIYQYNPFTFETIAFFLRVISEESDELIFTNLLHYLLSCILKCLRNLTEDCEETFEELNAMIKSQKIKLSDDKDTKSETEEEDDIVDSHTIWSYFLDISKFLLTVIDWKENTAAFFIFVLQNINESELIDLLKILKALIYNYIIEEGIAKAAFFIRHIPEQRQFILKILDITPESPNTWPDSCRKYISTFFP